MSEQVKVLSETESLCPDCLRRIPAKRVARGNCVYLEKACPEHGMYRTKIWQGEPSFQSWVRPKVPATVKFPFTGIDRGCPFDCGLCPAHRQLTCCVLLEVTGRCNLKCPFCFAGAGNGDADPDLDTIRNWYRRLLDAGGPFNVQLSGGEPTLRDDLPELVALGRSMGFSYIQLNTNGLRLSREPRYLESLKKAGLSSVFLQFDGTEQEIHRRMRGRDLLEEKLEAVRLCGETGIGVVLVPTVVPGINDHNLGQIIKLALELMPAVRGVHFQPVSYFGRFPGTPSDRARITLPEIISGIEAQTEGLIRAENFRPPGCENALCSFHGNFVLMPDGKLLATTRHKPPENCCGRPETAEEGARRARNFVAAHWPAPESSKCSCSEDNKAADGLDLFLARARTHTLCISGMAFQDVWNIDLERLKDCCIHTVAPDGRIIPFCAYNLTGKTGRPLYRGCESTWPSGGRR